MDVLVDGPDWYFAVLVLVSSTFFILHAVWESFVMVARERSARLAEEQAARNAVHGESEATVERYSFRTRRGDNFIQFPLRTRRIGDVWLLINDVQVMLHEVAEPTDMREFYNFESTPSFWRREDSSTISLWPVPDGAYHLSAALFTVDSPGVSYFTNPLAGEMQLASRHAYDRGVEKSIDLLVRWLTPEQQSSLEKNDHFVVTGEMTKTKYRVNLGSVFNVQALNKHGDPVSDMCFQPANAPFIGDIMLAQKLTLETNEKEALRVANKRVWCSTDYYSPNNMDDLRACVTRATRPLTNS